MYGIVQGGGINNSVIMNLYDWRGSWDRGCERLGCFIFGVTWREGRLGLGDCIPEREEGLMGQSGLSPVNTCEYSI